MMNFNEFQDRLLADMNERVQGCTFELQRVEKLQNQSYNAIGVYPLDGNIAFTLDVDAPFQKYQNGADYDSCLDGMLESCSMALEGMPQIDVNMLTDYDAMKSHLNVQLISTETNKEMLANIPHQEMEDLSIIYRLTLTEGENGSSSSVITNDMLDQYGVTMEELHHDAIEAAMQRNPAEFAPLEELMLSLMVEEGGLDAGELRAAFGLPEPNENSMYVITNASRQFGAAALTYPGLLDQVADQLNGNLFILPSSIHEVIVLREREDLSRADLEEMVQDVNATEVGEGDKLSDHVYHYDKEARVFELASNYEQRMAEKEAAPAMEQDAPSGQAHADAGDKLYVLKVEPEKYPVAVEIGGDLESLQDAVGGNIEYFFPFDGQYENNMAAILNEEGKLQGLPLNRAIYNDGGELADIIAGTFYVVGIEDGQTCSLTPEQMEFAEERFHRPEAFLQMCKGIKVIPINDEAIKAFEKAMEKAELDAPKPKKDQEVLS